MVEMPCSELIATLRSRVDRHFALAVLIAYLAGSEDIVRQDLSTRRVGCAAPPAPRAMPSPKVSRIIKADFCCQRLTFSFSGCLCHSFVIAGMAFYMPESVSQMPFNIPQPFDVKVDKEFLETTKQKLRLARYPEEQSDFGPENWSQGAKVGEVKRLADYWKTNHDWKIQEASLPVGTTVSSSSAS
jgi:Epoxide hydrolase N terminus